MLYKEVHFLNEFASQLPSSNIMQYDNESTLFNIFNTFLKQTSFKFPIQFVELILSNEKRENYLTDIVFFNRHPERKNKPLVRNEKVLIKEWLSIRKVIVHPVLNYLYGKQTNIAKLSGKDLFDDILRHIKTWIDAYIIALDNFKYVTEKSTKKELNDLKGISGKFLFEIAKELVDIINDLTDNKIIFFKVAFSVASIIMRYEERQEQYKALKNKNAVIDFVISEKEFFSNIKITLDNQYREISELLVPMVNQDKLIRLRFEDVYKKSKKLSTTNQEALFKLICEKWVIHAKGYLKLLVDKNMSVFETYINAPFGAQIAEQFQRKGNGTIDLEEFRVIREIIFFPFSDKNTKRDAVTFRISCVKTPDNSIVKVDNSMANLWIYQNDPRGEIREAFNKFLGFVQGKLPSVSNIKEGS